MSNINIETRVSASRALLVLEEFRKIDKDMPIGAAVTFLLIALEDDMTLTEIADKGGFVLSSASRYVQSLGEMDRHHREGHALVTDPVDMMNRRKKVRALTAKGNRVLAAITNILARK